MQISLPLRKIFTFLFLIFVLRMNLTTVSKDVELVTSSPTSWKAYVETPGLSERVAYPPYGPYKRATLRVPHGHVPMVSLVHLLLREDASVPDTLFLYVGGGEEPDEPIVWRVTGSGQPPVRVIQGSEVISVVLRTSSRVSPPPGNVSSAYTLGFRLLVTYHPEEEKPEKDAEGLYWNCSVPFWSKFQYHFDCNMEKDCVNGEDESQCPYTTPKCGSDMVTMGDNCYFLLPPSHPNTSLSWNQARKQCGTKGGRLASLNTPREWRAVEEAIQGRRSSNVFIGLHYNRHHLPNMYRSLWYWTDETTALYIQHLQRHSKAFCSYFSRARTGIDSVVCYEELNSTSFLCELRPQQSASRNISGISISLPINITQTFVAENPQKYSLCPDNHLTQIYLQSGCQKQEPESPKDEPEDPMSSHPVSSHPVPSPPVYYTCLDEKLGIPYSFMCDSYSQCEDRSDESFCVLPDCPEISIRNFKCGNGQCIPMKQHCDEINQCFDLTDEPLDCDYASHTSDVMMTSAMGSVSMDKAGRLQVMTPRVDSDCPLHTHFQCHLKDFFCLPVYLRCNGVKDCPGGEDEAECPSACPGFYRCDGSSVCLHPSHLCDSVVQCPKWDDERFCDVVCPSNCTCFGLEFVCGLPFPASEYPDMRFLDAGGSGMRLANLTENKMLVYLSLARNRLRSLEGFNFSNLLHLDVSSNIIMELRAVQLLTMPNLRHLSLSLNPLRRFLASQPALSLANLHVLDLSHVMLTSLNGTVFDTLGMTSLHTLILSYSSLREITGRGFRPLRQLRVLMMDGCPLETFPHDLLRGLYHLEKVFAENHRICCSQVLPDHFKDKNYLCLAPSDEISSCDSLLQENVYRFCMYISAILAVLCNLGSFVYRRCSKDGGSQDHSCHVFVSYLCLADFLMGVYLVILSVADQVYKDEYVWWVEEWKGSVYCTAAGFVCLLSSEISVLLIFLITIDRLIALRHPLSRFVFTHRSAHAMSILTWLFGVAMAAYPLLAHWNFYNQTDVCIPLPITRNVVIAHYYSFGIIIVFNLTIFIFIAASQALIYRTLRLLARDVTEPESGAPSTPPKVDLSITRRLIAIAMTDFLCWFPISILGIAAGMDVPIPGEVNVAVTIFVLPINSIVNPYLYTLSLIGQRRRERRRREMEEEEEEEEGYVMSNVTTPNATSYSVGAVGNVL